MIQSHRQNEFCEFDVFRIRPRLGGLPALKRLHGKIWPRLRGLPGLPDRATRLGGSPHVSCKRDLSKMRDYMVTRVTLPKRVTSSTWGPLPPCKQALTNLTRINWNNRILFCAQRLWILNLSSTDTELWASPFDWLKDNNFWTFQMLVIWSQNPVTSVRQNFTVYCQQ